MGEDEPLSWLEGRPLNRGAKTVALLDLSF